MRSGMQGGRRRARGGVRERDSGTKRRVWAFTSRVRCCGPACRPSRGVDGSAGARRSALHRARTLRASLAGPCRAVGVIRLRSVRSGCCRRSDSNWGGESGARDSGRVSRVRLPPIYHPNQCFSRRCKDHPKLPVKGRCDTACGPQWSVQRRQGVARDHGHVQRHPRHRHRRGGRRGDTGADTCHEVKAKAVTTATHLPAWLVGKDG